MASQDIEQNNKKTENKCKYITGDQIDIFDHTDSSHVPNFNPDFFMFRIHIRNPLPDRPHGVTVGYIRVKLIITPERGCCSYYHVNDYISLIKMDRSQTETKIESVFSILRENGKLPGDSTLFPYPYIDAKKARDLVDDMASLGIGKFHFLTNIIDKIWFFIDRKNKTTHTEQLKQELLDVDAMIQRTTEKIEKHIRFISKSRISVSNYPNIKRLRESFSYIFTEPEKEEELSAKRKRT